MSDDPTIPPAVAKAEAAAKSIWAWGHVHTYVAGIATGVVFMLALKLL